MPDVDLLPLALPPRWKGVHNYLVDGAGVDDVARATVRALAQTLRDVHGAPRLCEIAEQMRLAAHAAEYELDLGLSSPTVCRPRGDDIPTMIAEQVASSLLATRRAELALAMPEQALQTLALELVREFARHYGFDRIAVLLLRDPQEHPVELAARIDLALKHPMVATLAKHFAGNPTAKNLRAPSRPGSSSSISLDADLETFG
jgi:hypothetical protein